MNEKIDNFLTKWNEMMVAANEIHGFKYEFKLTISSDNSLIEQREKLINGVNKSFEENGMKYNSSSSN